MIIKTRKQLLDAYADPLKFVTAKKRKQLYVIQFLIALLLIAIGLIPFIFGGDGTFTYSFREMSAPGIVIVFLLLYGIYRLCTIKLGTKRYLRSKLVHSKLPINLD